MAMATRLERDLHHREVVNPVGVGEIVVSRIGRVSDSPRLQVHDVTATIGAGILVFGFHGNGPFSVARCGWEIKVSEVGLYVGNPRQEEAKSHILLDLISGLIIGPLHWPATCCQQA
jgi:hypothetical protein